MKSKRMLKTGIDLAMTVLLLCQMAYMLIGEIAHEWMGAAMFVLFILHHILNWKWYKNLGKGKYTALRILQTVVDFLTLFSMIGLMISSIILSREVFAFLPIEGGMNFARTLHMPVSYTHLDVHKRQSAVGLGCMGFSHAYGAPTEQKEAVRAIRAAYDLGYMMFDTAETYGTAADPHENEKLVGRCV